MSAPRWFTIGKDFGAPHLRILLAFTILAVMVGFGGVYARQTAVRSHTANQQKAAETTALATNNQPEQKATMDTNSNAVNPTMTSQSSSINPSLDPPQTNHPGLAAPLLTTLCDNASQTLAATKRQLAITSEDAYHQTQLTLITTGHALDRILRTSYYDSLISGENARHLNSLQAIDTTYTAALQAAHC